MHWHLFEIADRPDAIGQPEPGCLLGTYQPFEVENTYTMDIEEKVRAGNIANITDNLLLTEKRSRKPCA